MCNVSSVRLVVIIELEGLKQLLYIVLYIYCIVYCMVLYIIWYCILYYILYCILYGIVLHIVLYCILYYYSLQLGDSGSTVVKLLRYKSEGRWFDSSWFHWNFSLT